MAKLTGGFISNDVSPKTVRYIAGGGLPRKKITRILTPQEHEENRKKEELRKLKRKQKEEKEKAAREKAKLKKERSFVISLFLFLNWLSK